MNRPEAGKEACKPAPPELKPDTKVTTGGRNPHAHHGYVNTPVYHASTQLYRTAEDYLAHNGPYFYGRLGTPTSEALETAIRAIEGPACAGVALLPSGLAAISTALLAVLKSGDHLLMTDTAYGPARRFCDGMLAGCGVTTTYYDPLIGEDIASLMRPNTRAVYTESPGSLTFEMQDIPAIARRGPSPRRAGADRQHLGEPAAPQGAGAWRRLVDPVRHQIYRRALRHAARHGVGQRGRAAAVEGHGLRHGTLRRPRRHESRRCGACARLPYGWRAIRSRD